MRWSDFWSLVVAGTVFAFAGLTIFAIVSLPIAVALLIWKAVFA
jgi:hypothetical protein